MSPFDGVRNLLAIVSLTGRDSREWEYKEMSKRVCSRFADSIDSQTAAYVMARFPLLCDFICICLALGCDKQIWNIFPKNIFHSIIGLIIYDDENASSFKVTPYATIFSYKFDDDVRYFIFVWQYFLSRASIGYSYCALFTINLGSFSQVTDVRYNIRVDNFSLHTFLTKFDKWSWRFSSLQPQRFYQDGNSNDIIFTLTVSVEITVVSLKTISNLTHWLSLSI